MIHEVCERLAEHLRDAERGVAALRLSVPLPPLDTPIDVVTVKHEFEIPYVAAGEIPASAYEGGCLVLVRRGDDAGEFSAPSSPELLSKSERVPVAVVVLFSRREDRALHQENRQLSSLLRVVRRSLGLFFESVPYAERSLRDVQLTHLLAPIRVVPTMAYLGEFDLMAGALLLDVAVTDRWAELITD